MSLNRKQKSQVMAINRHYKNKRQRDEVLERLAAQWLASSRRTSIEKRNAKAKRRARNKAARISRRINRRTA